MVESSPPRPDETKDLGDGAQALRDAAALYRQIWGTDPEPRSSRPGTLRGAPPGQPPIPPRDAGAGADVAERLAALERQIEELIPQLEARELEALEEHGRTLASLEARLAGLERELREFTRSFNGRVDRVERNLHRFVDLSRRMAAAHGEEEFPQRPFEH
jgi:hypothetical protein